MIVVGYNNGKTHLKRLLDSLISVDHIDEPILILDTGSTYEEDIIFFNDLINIYGGKLKIITDKTPYSGYCSGAYIYAMNNYLDHELFDGHFKFFQDSVEFKSKEFFNLTNALLSDSVVTTIYKFPSNGYDSNEQIEFVKELVGNNNSDAGIFGPMFSITCNAIKKIKHEWLHIPKNKVEEMAMERAWGVIFKNINLTVVAVEGDLVWNSPHMPGKYIDKHFGQRR